MQEPNLHSSIAERDRIIEQHRTYVRALAIEVMRKVFVQVDLSELVGYGNIGLVEAAERYDPRRGVSFSTFSYYRIKGAIYDGLREMGYYSRSEYMRMRGSANDMMRTVADDALAERDAVPLSLDDEISDAQSTIDDLIPIFLLSLDSDSRSEALARTDSTASGLHEHGETANLLRKVVAELPEEYRHVIEEVYFKDTSMIELAAKMKVNRSWISRLHARAIKALRQSLQQEGLLDAD